MAKDPICGMQVSDAAKLRLNYNGETFLFCSENCLKKFAREKQIDNDIVASCLSCPNTPLYKNKSVIVASVLIFVVFLSYILPFLSPFKVALFKYFISIWWAILLGFFIGGVIDYYIPRQYISHILAKPRKRTIFYAVILGFFMSACSHGILALSIELHKKGAANPSVVAFLLASPWANMTLTIMLIGFFGLKAFFIIFSAILIAIISGFIFRFLESRNLIEKNKNTVQTEDKFSIWQDIKDRARGYKISPDTIKADIKGIYSGMVSLADMVLWWILIGIGIASLIGAYVPSHIFNHYMGPTLFGLLATLVFATVIEVCSEGSAPIAFEIFRQTKALGNSFVFLMAGVVTDYTEIGLLWHNVGKKTAIWLPIVTVPQVVLLGIIANIIFK